MHLKFDTSEKKSYFCIAYTVLIIYFVYYQTLKQIDLNHGKNNPTEMRRYCVKSQNG